MTNKTHFWNNMGGKSQVFAGYAFAKGHFRIQCCESLSKPIPKSLLPFRIEWWPFA